MNAEWTRREIEILEILALVVRAMSLEQVAHAFYDKDEDLAEHSLRPLVEFGLVQQLVVRVHPMLSSVVAAFEWRPGEPTPTDEMFSGLARRFEQRWSQAEVQMRVYVATRKGLNLMGSYLDEAPKEEQFTHDLHVAEIYVSMRDQNPPEVIKHILGEGAFPKLGKTIRFAKDPDLFLCDENRQALQVIEFCGSYDEKHLRDLHEHCAGRAHRSLVEHFPDQKYRLYPKAEGTPYAFV